MLSKNFLADLSPYRRCPHTADNAETLAWRRTTANQRARFIVTPASACTARGDIIIRFSCGYVAASAQLGHRIHPSRQCDLWSGYRLADHAHSVLDCGRKQCNAWLFFAATSRPQFMIFASL